MEQVPYDSNNIGGGAYEDKTVKGSKQNPVNSSNTRFDRSHSVQLQNHTRTINSNNLKETRKDDSNDFRDSNNYFN